MKFFLPSPRACTFGLILATGFGSAAASQELRFTPLAGPQFAPGTSFDVAIDLLFSPSDVSSEDVIGVSFDLTADAVGAAQPFPALQLTDITRPAGGGDFPLVGFQGDVRSQDFKIGPGEAGNRDFGGSTGGVGESMGPVDLGVFTFSLAGSLGPGTYQLSLSDVQVDNQVFGELTDFQLTATPFEFTVVVPEPTTAGLLVGGVAMLIARRRRGVGHA